MGKIVDLTGQKFGRLTVVKFYSLNKNKKSLWECKCDCGSSKTIIVTNSNLRNWKNPSCGCLAKELEIEKKKEERIGKVFGKLTIIDYAYTKENNTYWKCKCSCGNEKIIILPYCSLSSGHNRSCGCLHKERIEKINARELPPPNYKHGDSNERLYRIYHGIKDRCNNKNNKNYLHYGLRGIKMCQSWFNSYETFKEWSLNNGYNENLSIDRIDVNGDYCPENCRWVNIIEQNNNKRTNIKIEYNGDIISLKQLSNLVKINYQTLYERYKRGWALEDIIRNP